MSELKKERGLKRLVLDVLKPHMPLLPELAVQLSRLPSTSGVNISLIEVDKKKLLYTGDINLIDTNLIHPAETSMIPNIDAIITESTYGNKIHPPLEKSRKKLFSYTKYISKEGGKLIIPSFAVGRTQTLIYFLNEIYICKFKRFYKNSRAYTSRISRRI